jgi:hypothetical protein
MIKIIQIKTIIQVKTKLIIIQIIILPIPRKTINNLKISPPINHHMKLHYQIFCVISPFVIHTSAIARV